MERRPAGFTQDAYSRQGRVERGVMMCQRCRQSLFEPVGNELPAFSDESWEASVDDVESCFVILSSDGAAVGLYDF